MLLAAKKTSYLLLQSYPMLCLSVSRKAKTIVQMFCFSQSTSMLSGAAYFLCQEGIICWLFSMFLHFVSAKVPVLSGAAYFLSTEGIICWLLLYVPIFCFSQSTSMLSGAAYFLSKEGIICWLFSMFQCFVSAKVPVCCQVLHISSVRKALFVGCFSMFQYFVSAKVPVCCPVLHISSVRKALFVGCSLCSNVLFQPEYQHVVRCCIFPQYGRHYLLAGLYVPMFCFSQSTSMLSGAAYFLCQEGIICWLFSMFQCFVSAKVPVCCQVLRISSVRKALFDGCSLCSNVCFSQSTSMLSGAAYFVCQEGIICWLFSMFQCFVSAKVPVCCQVLRISSVRKALFVGCSQCSNGLFQPKYQYVVKCCVFPLSGRHCLMAVLYVPMFCFSQSTSMLSGAAYFLCQEGIICWLFSMFLCFVSAKVPVCCQVLHISSVRKALFVGCSLCSYVLFQPKYQYVVRCCIFPLSGSALFVGCPNVLFQPKYQYVVRCCIFPQSERHYLLAVLYVPMFCFSQSTSMLSDAAYFLCQEGIVCWLFSMFLCFVSAKVPVCCQVLRISSVRKALFVGCSLQMVQQLAGINTVM